MPFAVSLWHQGGLHARKGMTDESFSLSVPAIRSHCRHHHPCCGLHHRPGSHHSENFEMGQEEKRILRKARTGRSENYVNEVEKVLFFLGRNWKKDV